MQSRPKEVARIPALAAIVFAILALFAGARAAAAQAAARLDTASAHIFGGQPFRLDALTPWRRTPRALTPAGGATVTPAEDPANRPFRLRSKSAPAESPGFLSVLADALVPVLGISRDQLKDSWGNARRGHSHRGIDIMAPKGTPVVAAVDGAVLKMKWDAGGGRTLRLVDESRHYVFYYAHLSRYATGLKEGEPVHKGQVVAYVGRTGSVHGSAHLHLGIASLLDDADHWWNARPLNPYALLRHALGLPCDSTSAGARCGEASDTSR